MSGVKRGQGLKATYCDVCVYMWHVRTCICACGAVVHGARACPRP